MVGDPYQFTYILDEFGKKKKKTCPKGRFHESFFTQYWKGPYQVFLGDVAKVAIIHKPV
jgi:hypothetical protein